MKLLRLMADLSLGRLLILAVLSTVAYYLVYFDSGSSIQEQITNIEGVIATETVRRGEIEKVMKKEEEMRGNLLQLRRNLEVVKSKIPNEFQATQMSAIINNASTISGINVIELSTNPVAPRPPSPPPNPGDPIRPEDLVEEVKFNITVTGSYESFLRFLDVLTKEDKVIKIRNFSIERTSDLIEDNSIRFKGEVVGFKQAENLKQQGLPPDAAGGRP